MTRKTRIIAIVLVLLFLPTLVWLAGTAWYQLGGGRALYQLKRSLWGTTASNALEQRLYAVHDSLYSVLSLVVIAVCVAVRHGHV